MIPAAEMADGARFRRAFAGEGLRLEDLSLLRRLWARGSVHILVGRARLSAARLRGRAWLIDRYPDDFLFDSKGRILTWVDPLIPLTRRELRLLKLGPSDEER